VRLAECMVSIGEGAGRDTRALITGMDAPLGRTVGNSLEVVEAVETLKGNGPEDLTEICLRLSAIMLAQAEKGPEGECRKMAGEVIKSGAAFAKFREWIMAQGGDAGYIDDTDKFRRAETVREVKSPADGFIHSLDSERCGLASVVLGAGREAKDDKIDYSAGIVIAKKPGDRVERGETLAVLHTKGDGKANEAENIILESYRITDKKPEEKPLIYAYVNKEGVTYF